MERLILTSTMEVKDLKVGQLDTNCYLVYGRGSADCVIIDPGDDAEYISEIILRYNLRPVSIIATHGHFDHIMATTALKMIFKIPFCMNEGDKFLLDRSESTAEHFTGVKYDPMLNLGVDIPLRNMDIIKFGHESLKVVTTPGHTPGSVSLINEKNRKIFCGDLFFADRSVGRTDFKYGDKKILAKSLVKIKELGKDYLIYPGHGSEFYL